MGRGKKPRQNLPSARRHCIICDKIIATQSGLEMHMNQHTGERPYFCRYCDATFTSKSSEVVHTQGVHLGVKHPCPKCEKEYKSQSNLSAHVKYCTGTGNVTKVSRKTGNTGSKGRAEKLQEKQKERKVKREVSEKKKGGGGRVRKNDKKKGQIRMSVPVPEEKSGVFGSFRSAASVYAQLLQLEQEEEEAQKNQDYSFFLHLNRYKPDDSCFSPNYPPPRVNTPEEVEERVPLNASPVEEEEEQEEEEDDWNSKQMEVEKKKKLIKKTSALKAVKRKRSSGGSKGKFKCRQCGKAYQAQANLNEHLLMHSGVKPFPCHFCKVAFTKKFNLIRHIAGTHQHPEQETSNEDATQQEKSKRRSSYANRCGFCGQVLHGQISKLQRHILTEHPEMVEEKGTGSGGDGEEVKMED